MEVCRQKVILVHAVFGGATLNFCTETSLQNASLSDAAEGGTGGEIHSYPPRPIKTPKILIFHDLPDFSKMSFKLPRPKTK